MVESYEYDDKYYEDLSEGWFRLSFPFISKHVFQIVKDYSPQCILDFGCGNGDYSSLLSSDGGDIEGCDISPESLIRCKNLYNWVFEIKDSKDLISKKYDFIFSTEVLEHIEKWEETVDDLYRALSSNGVLFLTTTTYSPTIFAMISQVNIKENGVGYFAKNLIYWFMGFFSALKRDEFVKKWCFESTGGHFHGFFTRELVKAFTDSGFTVLDSGVFYAIEPIQMSRLHSTNFKEIASNRNLFFGKKIVALALFLVGNLVNKFFKATRLFANNTYIVAQK